MVALAGYTDNAGVPRCLQGVALLNPDGTAAAAAAFPILGAGTDRSGAITTASVAQTVAPALATRTSFTFQNTSAAAMRVTETGAAATATTGYSVAAGAFFNAKTRGAISVFCATAASTFAATETV